MKIVFAVSECAPYVKTGGLADVAGSLPPALLAQSKKPLQIIRVLPRYSVVEKNFSNWEVLPGKILVPIGDRLEAGTIGESTETNSRKKRSWLKTYFIGNKKYFDRPGIYRSKDKDFDDNDERFIFFSRAVLELCKWIDFQPDILHCHDWQTGLIPAYLKTVYQIDAFFHKTAALFTIHNIAYQGNFPKHSLFLAGFSWHDFTPAKLEYYDQLSFLKAGLIYADKITTVSPTYAKEIQSSPKFGCGMEGILKTRDQDFVGILNGLDEEEWNPAKDREIAVNFSAKSKDYWSAKQKCKLDLQRALHFEPVPAVPLVGMVTRLDRQKGINLLPKIVPELIARGRKFQWVVLGLGDRALQELLENLAKQAPNFFVFHNEFNNSLAHKIYAGSDIFFMPSEFEPCGIAQMIALRYGTVPVVSAVGGLKDTVLPFSSQTGKGTGFVCAEFSEPAFLETLETAFSLYRQQESWQKLVSNALSQNFSWKRPAEEYLKLYQSLITLKGE